MKVRTQWKKCKSCGLEHQMRAERCMLCGGGLEIVFVGHFD
jgi:hypothetical protein